VFLFVWTIGTMGLFVVVVAILTMVYLFQWEWKYNPKNVVFVNVVYTLFVSGVFLGYTLLGSSPSPYADVLIVACLGGPTVDMVFEKYPSTGVAVAVFGLYVFATILENPTLAVLPIPILFIGPLVEDKMRNVFIKYSHIGIY
jgi:hypothetical protein